MSNPDNPHADMDLVDGDIENTADEPKTYVTFEIGDQWFAISVEHVREILDRQAITPLPQAPSCIEGVIDVRGVGILVFDLPGRLGLRPVADTEHSRFLVFEFDGGKEESTAVSVKADRVLEVSQIPDEVIEPTPRAGLQWDTQLIDGITRNGDRIVVLLNFAALFPSAAEAMTRNGDDIFDFAAA